MPQDALKPDERAVLLVLTALGTEVSNPQLEKAFGFEIGKPVRIRLEQLKLINTTTGARGAYFHEATSDGWGRAADELVGELPVSRAGKAAAMLLANQLHGYLTRADLRLLDVFVPDIAVAAAPVAKPVKAARKRPKAPSTVPTADPDVETQVRTAYRELAATPGSPVLLSRLRTQLANVPRDELDVELRRLNRARRINLSPESNRKGLTEADEAAALRIGRQDKHLIVMELR